MPPQNILISLRCAPLHQDILHRGLTNSSIQFILKKKRERPISCSYHKVIFLQLIVFTEIFSQSHLMHTWIIHITFIRLIINSHHIKVYYSNLLANRTYQFIISIIYIYTCYSNQILIFIYYISRKEYGICFFARNYIMDTG